MPTVTANRRPQQRQRTGRLESGIDERARVDGEPPSLFGAAPLRHDRLAQVGEMRTLSHRRSAIDGNQWERTRWPEMGRKWTAAWTSGTPVTYRNCTPRCKENLREWPRKPSPEWRTRLDTARPITEKLPAKGIAEPALQHHQDVPGHLGAGRLADVAGGERDVTERRDHAGEYHARRRTIANAAQEAPAEGRGSDRVVVG
jgi:hypothetical protein